MAEVDVLDFDNIDDWAPEFAAALSRHVPDLVGARLVAEAPKFIEDARNLVLTLTNRDAVISAALNFICSEKIAGYHGSRLTEAELASVRLSGLVPLKGKDRRRRLTRALSPHPKWLEVAPRLDAVIQARGGGSRTSRREDQVHLTLSRAGLIGNFNHYLTHGSEFDQCVAYTLLGSDGMELLARDGSPRIIRASVPGALAVDAAHPHFSLNDVRAKGEVPNLVDEFLKAWSFRLAHQGFQSRSLRIDCGMVFRSAVPASWITGFEDCES